MVTVESPFPVYALPRVWSWTEESRRQVADDFSPQTLEEFVEFWERQSWLSWAVERDGELGGVVTSTRLNPVLADFHCIFKRAFWGHGIGMEALRLVFEQLFADRVEKITTLAFADNHALLGVASKLGFKREGTIEKSTLRAGELVDQAIVGVTKERFYGVIGGTRSDHGAVRQQPGEPHHNDVGNGHHLDQRDQQHVAKPDARPGGAVEHAVSAAAKPDDSGRRRGSGSAVYSGVQGRDQ